MKIEKKTDKKLKDILDEFDKEIIYWTHTLGGGNEVKLESLMKAMKIDDVRDFLHLIKKLVKFNVLELIAMKEVLDDLEDFYYEVKLRLKYSDEVYEILREFQ